MKLRRTTSVAYGNAAASLWSRRGADGQAMGLDESGALLLRGDSGEVEAVTADRYAGVLNPNGGTDLDHLAGWNIQSFGNGPTRTSEIAVGRGE